MKFIHADLGTVPAGSVVVAELAATAANVLLLDPNNCNRYRRSDSYRYYGGHFRNSPARVGVPTTGHWHAVVDLGGATGNVRANIRVIAA